MTVFSTSTAARLPRWVPVAVLLFGLACQRIPLAEMDLGRHLATGYALLQQQPDAAFTNFHSVPAAQFEVVNHHWLSGVFFALIHAWVGGWAGLIVTHALLLAFAVGLTAQAFRVDGRLALVAAPLVIVRWQVRPEAFTLVGLSVLLSFGRTMRPWMVFALFALWVNLHIGFAVGLAVLVWTVFCSREGWWKLAAAVGGCLVNPNHWRGLVAPLAIWGNYDYPIGENLPLWHWIPVLTGERPLFALWFALAGITGFCLLRRLGDRYTLGLAILGLVLGMAMFRNLSLLGLLALPLLGSAFARPNRVLAWSLAGLSILATQTYWEGQGLSLTPSSEEALRQAAPLLRDGAVIFNSFDTGSFVDFATPGKAWTDNRPEAYPPGFFENSVRRPMEDEAAWQVLLAQWKFDRIVMGPLDQTEWGQTFLARRRADPGWRVAFENEALVVFVASSQSAKGSALRSATNSGTLDADPVLRVFL